MLFARPGEYKPCGIFSLEHFGLIAVTIVCIAIAIKNTYKSSKEEVKKIYKKLYYYAMVYGNFHNYL